jgi:hypothetical protein
MKKKLASVEAEKECVRGEEAKKREEEKGRSKIQDLEEKNSLREEEKRTSVQEQSQINTKLNQEMNHIKVSI